MTPPSAPAAARPAGPRRRPGEFGAGRKFTPRRKVCAFCVDKIKTVDYKDLSRLRRFLSERGKIEPRRKTGTCAAHQRSLNVALKNARLLALLPFTAEHIRITGVPAREPGGPPFRGPRPPRFPEGGDGEAPPAEADVSENGAVAAAAAAAPEAAGAPEAAVAPEAALAPEAAVDPEAAAPATTDSPDAVAETPAAEDTPETPERAPTTPEA
jgi:small subunit ribosomal protein S18